MKLTEGFVSVIEGEFEENLKGCHPLNLEHRMWKGWHPGGTWSGEGMAGWGNMEGRL